MLAALDRKDLSPMPIQALPFIGSNTQAPSAVRPSILVEGKLGANLIARSGAFPAMRLESAFGTGAQIRATHQEPHSHDPYRRAEVFHLTEIHRLLDECNSQITGGVRLELSV